MSASHGCCQKTPKSAQDNAVATKAMTYHPIAVALLWVSAAEWLNLNPVLAGSVESTDASPPQSPPRSISVLKI